MGIAQIPAPSGAVTPKVQEFTSTGTFTAPSNTSMVEVFLVGGGGGGGSVQTSGWGSGGGGGGQVIQWRKLSVTPGTAYTVTIGAGGAGAGLGAAYGAVGGDTSFGSLATALGGGGGGSELSTNPQVPVVRGTMGGYAQSGGDATFGGGASTSNYAAKNGTTPFSAVQGIIQNIAVTNYAGAYQPMDQAGAAHFSPVGIDGFGGGGAGSAGGSTSSLAYNINFHGGAIGRQNQNGNAGQTNKGGGGSGTRGNGTGNYTGGNGGSGYALVLYYS